MVVSTADIWVVVIYCARHGYPMKNAKLRNLLDEARDHVRCNPRSQTCGDIPGYECANCKLRSRIAEALERGGT